MRFLIWLPLLLWGEETALRIEEKNWSRRGFETGGIPESEAAGFALLEDAERGLCLAVGPWRAGSYSVRFEYNQKLPVVSGRLRGFYRTLDLLPGQALAAVQFYKGNTRLSVANFPLAPAPEWTPFEVPVRRAPPGAETIVAGFGLAEKTEGRVLFTSLAASTEPWATEFPEEPGPLRRPAPPLDFKGAPRYRLEQRDGTWWLVTPQGRGFFSLGVDAPSFPVTPEGLAQGRRHRSTMRRLGFNSLAGWHDVRAWSALNDLLRLDDLDPMPQFRALESGTMKGDFDRLTNAQGQNAGTHAFPDPFDPRWEVVLRGRVRSLAERIREESYFVAWFADNEVAHRDLYRYVYSTHCAAAFRKFLEDRHQSITALNRAWGREYTSFEDLLKQKPDPALRHGPIYEDFHAFMREIVRRYVETVVRVIRQEDPGRLIFSNRFMLGEIRDWLEVLDLYAPFDGIAVNMYPLNLTAGLSANERAILQQVHARTGKPILITEWSVPALDSGLYDNPDKLDWSYPNTVQTQTDRARQAAQILTDFYNLRFVVGAHWFIWTDFDSPARQANRGLFKASGEPWTELQEALRKVQEKIKSL